MFLSRSEARFFSILIFPRHAEAPKNSFSPFRATLKHQKSLFHAYVVDRNTYFLFFMLMSLAETPIFSFSRLCRWQKRLFFSICSFWNVQKHEKPPFALSETFRSIKILHLLFLKRSEARKSVICSFWNVQKHEKPLFGLSETFRSMKTRKLFARLPYNLYFCMQMKICLT